MASGKKAKFGEVAKNATFKVYSWEKEMIKNYLKTIRKIRLEYDKMKDIDCL